MWTGPNNLAIAEHIELSHWLYSPGSGATCVRVSRAAQLVALGLASGEVALYGLWASQGAEPVRIISLGHWGYEPETTGSVADIQWSPDSRALAVSPSDDFTPAVTMHTPLKYTAHHLEPATQVARCCLGSSDALEVRASARSLLFFI